MAIKFSDYDIEWKNQDITWDKVQYDNAGTVSFGGAITTKMKYRRTIEGDV